MPTTFKPNLSAVAPLLTEKWAMSRERVLATLSRVAQMPHGPAKQADVEKPDSGECLDGYRIVNGVAIVPIVGVLTKYPSCEDWIDEWCGFIPAMTIRNTIETAMNDWTVKSIMLRIDCPGGLVAGTNELMEYIAKISGTGPGQKPVHASISDLAASGGYLLASQCESITCNAWGEAGCIGVYCVLLDDSKFWEEMGISWELISSGGVKGLGADGKITPELRTDVQRGIDDTYRMFVQAVADGRGIDFEQAKKLGDGRSWIAAQAKQLGLIDEVASVDDAMAAIFKEIGTMPITPQQFSEHAASNPGAAEVLALVNQGKQQAANQPATPQELAAAFPNDPAFAMSQLTAGASLNTALIAGCKHLSERLTQAQGAADAQIKTLTEQHKTELSARDKEIDSLKAELGTQSALSLAGAAKKDAENASQTPVDPNADPETVAKAEWAKMDAAAKGKWISEDAYVAFRKQELKGKVSTTKLTPQ
jgi:signal peptide peptidase SppA